MEDSQIIALYFRRSEQAIQETDNKYGRYCFQIANRILESPEDGEECVSDTYLTAWKSIPPNRPIRLAPFLGENHPPHCPGPVAQALCREAGRGRGAAGPGGAGGVHPGKGHPGGCTPPERIPGWAESIPDYLAGAGANDFCQPILVSSFHP